MESILGSATSTMVANSLDLTMLRHQVIANNIANANTQGYRPLKVDFEAALKSVNHDFALHGDLKTLEMELEHLMRDIAVEVDEASTKVLLDREITRLAKNTINYQALISANSRLGEIMSSAIKGGRS